ncbi:hypothetical protein N9L68_02845 [bacterium]|nr:hypothetical protein [bacterium]
MADISPADLDVLMQSLRALRELNKAHLGRLRAVPVAQRGGHPSAR